MLDRADCADFGCHNSIRLETKHFLNTLALTFISFSGRFVLLCKNIIFFFASDPLVLLLVVYICRQRDDARRIQQRCFIYHSIFANPALRKRRVQGHCAVYHFRICNKMMYIILRNVLVHWICKEYTPASVM